MRTTRFAAILTLAFALVCTTATPPRAFAQRASEQVLAREQFRAGVDAAQAEQWETAVEAFQRSYELAPRPLTLLNLAGAYAQTGHLVEAVEALRMFLQERQGVTARMRTDAQAQLDELEPRVPRARIRVLGLEDGDVVRLDEYELSTASLDAPLPVNPGTHGVTLERPRAEPIVLSFEVAEGVTEDVLVDARTLVQTPRSTSPIDGRSTSPTDPEPTSRSIFEEPAFWIVVGAVVLAGGVTAGVVIGTQPGATTVGNLPPGQLVID